MSSITQPPEPRNGQTAIFDAPEIIKKRPHAVATLKPLADGKPEKRPRNPVTLIPAETSDIDTLGTYAEAVAAVKSGRVPVAGPVLKRCGLIVIDLDKCRNRETGEITPEAQRILQMFPGALVTISASGTGLHIWIKATPPKSTERAAVKATRNGQQVEILIEKFVIERWEPYGTPGEILPFQEQVDALYSELKEEAKPTPATVAPPAPLYTASNDPYRDRAITAELTRLKSTTEGDRNDTLNKVAFRLGQFVGSGRYNRADAEYQLLNIGCSIGLPGGEVKSTMKSGLDDGEKKPEYSGMDNGAAASLNGSMLRTVPSGAAPAHLNGTGPKSEESGGCVSFVSDAVQERINFTTEPQPLEIELHPVPEMPLGIIPEPLRDWVQDIAERMKCPIEYVAVAVLCAIGSLIGRAVGLRPYRYDDWLTICNLWGAAVGPPGVLKSPAVQEALAPLRRLMKEAQEAYKLALDEYEFELTVHGAQKDAAKFKLKDAAKKNKSEADLHEIARQQGTPEPEPPIERRYIVNDATVEALQVQMKDKPRGLLHYRDELSGFLRTMEKPGHEADRSYFLETWAGTAENYYYDRIGRGSAYIPALCLGMFGTIQPGPLCSYIREASSGEGADGLIQRFQLLVYPDLPEWKLVDRYPNTEAKTRAFEIFKALDALDPATIGAETSEYSTVPFLHFAPAAQQFFYDWLTELETTKLRTGQERPAFESHLSKYRSLMPELALLFHLVDVVDNTAEQTNAVSLAAAQRAAAWCELLEAHARRIYQSALDTNLEAAQNLADRIRQSLKKDALPNPFTFRDIIRKGWSGLTIQSDIEQAVNLLEGKGWLQVVEVPPGPNGGRATQHIHINPALIKEGEAK